MFAQVKQIFNPQNKDLRKRIVFTLVALFIFKLGTTIIVPGLDTSRLNTSNLGFMGLINAMGGGALEKFSIFSLGVMPYITASIIVQLLQMDIIPYFSELSKQGQVGRNKLNTITRVMGIVLAFIQGYMLSFAYVESGSVMDYMQFSVILTAGTAFLLWLGDQITTKGVGNGISLIIMAGIIATMPAMFMDAFNSFIVTDTVQLLVFGIFKFVLFVALYLAIIVGVVFVETAERRIPIQYANSSTRNLGKQSYIPFKLNSAGVIPVIFASALVSIPSLLATFIKNEGFQLFVSKWLTLNSLTGIILYIVFIFVFGYFYTFFQLKPKELAENLQKNGGYIPGVRPGEETVNYVTKILKRITIVGTTFLAILAALPIICSKISSLPSSVSIGGTGLLIVVGVALETYKQLESSLVTRKYTRGRK